MKKALLFLLLGCLLLAGCAGGSVEPSPSPSPSPWSSAPPSAPVSPLPTSVLSAMEEAAGKINAWGGQFADADTLFLDISARTTMSGITTATELTLVRRGEDMCIDVSVGDGGEAQTLRMLKLGELYFYLDPAQKLYLEVSADDFSTYADMFAQAELTGEEVSAARLSPSQETINGQQAVFAVEELGGGNRVEMYYDARTGAILRMVTATGELSVTMDVREMSVQIPDEAVFAIPEDYQPGQQDPGAAGF